MRVLVTGAAGFLGRAIGKALVAKGHQVTGTDMPVREWDPPPAFFAWDITRPWTTIPELDAVVHLAAVASPAVCDKDPGLAFRVNVQGTHNVLKLAVAAGAKRFILASSAHAYGISPLYLPTDERAPRSVFDTYTTTKLMSEQLCELFWENYGLSYAAIRLFNGYGPGQQSGYFIPDKIAQAQAGDFELRGAKITKDWVYIDDVVRAYVLALESSFVGAVNVATGVETDLETIGSQIAKAFGVRMTVPPSGLPTRMCGCYQRAERVLGWRPTITLEEGLDRTIQAWKYPLHYHEGEEPYDVRKD